jgi:heterotetrameric sarcosine oxidase gamma subunit
VPDRRVPSSGARRAAAAPIARTAIRVDEPTEVRGGWEVNSRVSTAALTLGDASRLTKVLIRGPEHGSIAAGLPAFGMSDRRDGTLRVGSGPGEWLLLAVGDSAAALATTVPANTGEFVSTVDITHGRALFRLTGADAAKALSKVCAIDLTDRVTPDASAFRSSIAAVTTDVIRDDRNGVRSYLLHCERSPGQYLFDEVLHAGAEFGIESTFLPCDGLDS